MFHGLSQITDLLCQGRLPASYCRMISWRGYCLLVDISWTIVFTVRDIVRDGGHNEKNSKPSTEPTNEFWKHFRTPHHVINRFYHSPPLHHLPHQFWWSHPLPLQVGPRITSDNLIVRECETTWDKSTCRYKSRWDAWKSEIFCHRLVTWLENAENRSVWFSVEIYGSCRHFYRTCCSCQIWDCLFEQHNRMKRVDNCELLYWARWILLHGYNQRRSGSTVVYFSSYNAILNCVDRHGQTSTVRFFTTVFHPFGFAFRLPFLSWGSSFWL